MTKKLVLASFAAGIPLVAALSGAPPSEARVRDPVQVRPMSEAEHARLIAELFGGDRDDAPRTAGAAADAAREAGGALQSGTVTSPSSPSVAHTVQPLPDPSWRRIDTFGIRETWGYTNPSHPDTSSLAFAFATVFVPSAYQHCHYNYEVVTDMEVRVVPLGGGPTTVIRAQLQLGESAVSLVIPASLWRTAERGRVLAWTAWGNPMVDAEAISDQEFSP